MLRTTISIAGNMNKKVLDPYMTTEAIAMPERYVNREPSWVIYRMSDIQCPYLLKNYYVLLRDDILAINNQQSVYL